MLHALTAGIDYIGIATPFYCNDGKGNFVLHKRSDKARDEKGRWDFGSGQLIFGEKPEEAVLREVKEEYGVKGIIQEAAPTQSILRIQSGIKTHWLALPFFVKVDLTKIRIMEPKKVTKIGIFTLDHLPKPLHSAVRLTLKEYSTYFDKYK